MFSWKVQTYLFIVVGGVFIVNGIFARPAKAILGCPSNAPMCPNTAFLTTNGQSDNIIVIHHHQRWPQSFRPVRQSFRPSIHPAVKSALKDRPSCRSPRRSRPARPAIPPACPFICPSVHAIRVSNPSNKCVRQKRRQKRRPNRRTKPF